jgi:hypothetical protein
LYGDSSTTARMATAARRAVVVWRQQHDSTTGQGMDETWDCVVDR